MLKGQSVLSTMTMAWMLLLTVVLFGYRQFNQTRSTQASAPSQTLVSRGQYR